MPATLLPYPPKFPALRKDYCEQMGEAIRANERIPEGVSQLIEPPAFAAMEKFFKSLDGELWMRHKGMIEY
jgi:hypothetical protein